MIHFISSAFSIHILYVCLTSTMRHESGARHISSYFVSNRIDYWATDRRQLFIQYLYSSVWHLVLACLNRFVISWFYWAHFGTHEYNKYIYIYILSVWIRQKMAASVFCIEQAMTLINVSALMIKSNVDGVYWWTINHNNKLAMQYTSFNVTQMIQSFLF